MRSPAAPADKLLAYAEAQLRRQGFSDEAIKAARPQHRAMIEKRLRTGHRGGK